MDFSIRLTSMCEAMLMVVETVVTRYIFPLKELLV